MKSKSLLLLGLPTGTRTRCGSSEPVFEKIMKAQLRVAERGQCVVILACECHVAVFCSVAFLGACCSSKADSL